MEWVGLMVHPFLIFGTDYMIFIPRKGLTFVFFLGFSGTDRHGSAFFNSSYLSLKVSILKCSLNLQAITIWLFIYLITTCLLGESLCSSKKWWSFITFFQPPKHLMILFSWMGSCSILSVQQTRSDFYWNFKWIYVMFLFVVNFCIVYKMKCVVRGGQQGLDYQI